MRRWLVGTSRFPFRCLTRLPLDSLRSRHLLAGPRALIWSRVASSVCHRLPSACCTTFDNLTVKSVDMSYIKTEHYHHFRVHLALPWCLDTLFVLLKMEESRVLLPFCFAFRGKQRTCLWRNKDMLVMIASSETESQSIHWVTTQVSSILIRT